MTHKTKLTDRDYEQIQNMTGLGMNSDDIASIIGISRETFDRMKKTDDVLREKIANGKAVSNLKILNTLHKQITREEVEKEQVTIIKNEKGEELSRESRTVRHAKEPNTRLLEFYLATKMGFHKTTKLEHTGNEGDPIRLKLSKMTAEELQEEIDKLDIE